METGPGGRRRQNGGFLLCEEIGYVGKPLSPEAPPLAGRGPAGAARPWLDPRVRVAAAFGQAVPEIPDGHDFGAK